MLATEAALHPAARFASTASPGTFRAGVSFPRSPVHADLWAVPNVRPGFNTHWGAWGGVLYAEFDTMLGGRVPRTLRHQKEVAPAEHRPDEQHRADGDEPRGGRGGAFAGYAR
ncbi:hypothetical protein K438DRAFT_1856698, partial [Mycena galopus ATCC 62051]